MSRPAATIRTATPGPPAAGAPLRAIDSWRAERTGDRATVHVRLNVRGEEPALRGHFPHLVVLPGVFVIEAVTQAIVLLGPSEGAGRVVLRAVRSVRFFAPLLDGDELLVVIDAQARSDGGWDVVAKASRGDGVKAAQARISFDRVGADDA